MLSELEQACISYSTESSSGLVEFDSNWQRIFVTALTFLLDQAILIWKKKQLRNRLRENKSSCSPSVRWSAFIKFNEAKKLFYSISRNIH